LISKAYEEKQCSKVGLSHKRQIMIYDLEILKKQKRERGVLTLHCFLYFMIRS